MSVQTSGVDRMERALAYAGNVMAVVTPQQLGDALQIDLAQPLEGQSATVPVVVRALIEVTRALSQMSREAGA